MKRSDIDDDHVIELARRWQVASRKPGGMWAMGALDALIAEGVPPKLAAAKISHLYDRGLLDWGVSIRYPWPT